MAYVKAIAGAVLAALLLGGATGSAIVIDRALALIPPGDRAIVLASSIGEAMNCAALYVLVLVPAAIVLAYFARRRRRGASDAASRGGA